MRLVDLHEVCLHETSGYAASKHYQEKELERDKVIESQNVMAVGWRGSRNVKEGPGRKIG